MSNLKLAEWAKGTLAGVLLAVAGGGGLTAWMSLGPTTETEMCKEAGEIVRDDQHNNAIKPAVENALNEAAAQKLVECFKRKRG